MEECLADERTTAALVNFPLVSSRVARMDLSFSLSLSLSLSPHPEHDYTSGRKRASRERETWLARPVFTNTRRKAHALTCGGGRGWPSARTRPPRKFRPVGSFACSSFSDPSPSFPIQPTTRYYDNRGGIFLVHPLDLPPLFQSSWPFNGG